MKVGVIGAGPAGITAAYQLTKAGIETHIYEAGSSVGGLAKTISLWKQRVDLGPHRFFSTDRRVNEVWLDVIGDDYSMVDRLTRIYYDRKFYNYPLKIGNALQNMGPLDAIHCLASYFLEKINPTQQDGSFEDWVVGQFGRHLFNIFFKSYSEKLWGISCKELDADFASQRIKKLSLKEALKNAIQKGEGNKHKTLVDRFAYPNQGSGIVYERMADFIEQSGNSALYLKQPVNRAIIERGKTKGLELADGQFVNYDHVISTMPLTLLVNRLEEVPFEVQQHAQALKFRNTTLVYLLIDEVSLFPDNWIYVHDPDLKLGRITNFRNWSSHLYGDESTSILALEYWSYDQDPLWNADDDFLIQLGTDEIQKTGLIKEAAVLDGHVVRIKRCYPVYDRNYKSHLKPIQDFLSEIDKLTVIGRYGAFKYNNQDHSILMGILAAEQIANDVDYSLWDINTNYETYQEEALITDTGLTKL